MVRMIAAGTLMMAFVLDQGHFEPTSPCRLFPIAVGEERGRRLAFMNRAGKQVFTTEFDVLATRYSEGMAVVQRGSRFGYIDETGKTKVEPLFDDAYDFVNDRAKVRVGTKFGYINKKGALVIPAKYCDAKTFAHGLAAVTLGCTASIAEWYFIDPSGTAVLGPYRWPESFAEDVALVGVGSIGARRWLFIDDRGSLVTPLMSNPLFIGSFSEGLALVAQPQRDGTGLYGFIDRTGDFKIQPQFKLSMFINDGSLSFHDGLARVRDTEGVGYIEKTGRWAIKPTFEEGSSFSEGLAAVRVKGHWGFIDKRGAVVITPQFDYANSFCGGLAQVGTSSEFGYVDDHGVFVWKRKR